jgi:hypothetical protein
VKTKELSTFFVDELDHSFLLIVSYIVPQWSKACLEQPQLGVGAHGCGVKNPPLPTAAPPPSFAFPQRPATTPQPLLTVLFFPLRVFWWNRKCGVSLFLDSKRSVFCDLRGAPHLYPSYHFPRVTIILSLQAH